jgi:hypothetical protein
MVSDEFKKNVATGDITLVRSSLVNYIMMDSTFKEFDEALQYAKLKMDIIEKNGEPVFNENTDNWDKAYFDKQLTALLFNFSEERIRHLKDIRKVLTKREVSNGSTTKTVIKNKEKRKRTGEKVISETIIEDTEGNNSNKQENYKSGKSESTLKEKTTLTTWMIGGGVVLLALGGVTTVLGATKITSALIKTGTVIAGAGVVMKMVKD